MRVTSSWALANVCEALRYRVNDRSFEGINAEVIIRHCYNFWIFTFSFFSLVGSNTTSQVVDSLIECALRLTEDGDKVMRIAPYITLKTIN